MGINETSTQEKLAFTKREIAPEITGGVKLSVGETLSMSEQEILEISLLSQIKTILGLSDIEESRILTAIKKGYSKINTDAFREEMGVNALAHG